MTSINTVMIAVPSKTTMPVMECIMIDASFNQIRFTANDMELGIETIVTGQILEKGSVALNAKIFSDIVKKMDPDDEVVLETNENYVTQIRSGSTEFNIPGNSGEDFTALPVVEREDSITISQFALHEVIRQTIFSIAVNENNKMMTGELFEVKNNTLKVVSLDGHRIAIRNVSLKDTCGDKKVVVPGKTLNEISRILNGEDDDMVTIYFARNYLQFEMENTRILSRLIDGEYFRIDQMLSSEYETKVDVNRQVFMKCLDKASLLVRESDKMPVVLEITDDLMKFSIESSMGAMNDEMDISKTGKDITIGFNPRFLMDALKVIDDETVSLYFINAKAPCFIRDDEGSYVYLILPVNIYRG